MLHYFNVWEEKNKTRYVIWFSIFLKKRIYVMAFGSLAGCQSKLIIPWFH